MNTNNITTYLVWAWTIIGPYLSAYMNQEQFTTIGIALIGLIMAIYSSYKPNQLEWLGNDIE